MLAIAVISDGRRPPLRCRRSATTTHSAAGLGSDKSGPERWYKAGREKKPAVDYFRAIQQIMTMWLVVGR